MNHGIQFPNNETPRIRIFNNRFRLIFIFKLTLEWERKCCYWEFNNFVESIRKYAVKFVLLFIFPQIS